MSAGQSSPKRDIFLCGPSFKGVHSTVDITPAAERCPIEGAASIFYVDQILDFFDFVDNFTL